LQNRKKGNINEQQETLYQTLQKMHKKRTTEEEKFSN
jgi:hypothetical protein